MSTILTHECHLHLYGCLPLKFLWSVSESRSRQFHNRFQWFLQEYESTTGRRLDPSVWWRDEKGFETFKDDICCNKPMSFQEFQAKFNLLIALFPPSSTDMELPKEVFKSQSIIGGYKEYRTFLPGYLSDEQKTSYLSELIHLAIDASSREYKPSIAISIPRYHDSASTMYKYLCFFLDQNKHLTPWISGIDFCGSETGFAPSEKINLFNRIISDNKDRRRSLKILYHVGETWENIALHSAARWCLEAAQYGADRLGHAIALGLNPDAIRGRILWESPDESKSHLAWIRQNMAFLSEYGFTALDYNWLKNRAERNTNSDRVQWLYDDDLIDHTIRFQTAATYLLKSIQTVVEVCPSSNLRIASIKDPSHHSIHHFAKHDVNMTLSTDDPGIFDITIHDEENLCRTTFGLNDDQLKKCQDLTQAILTNQDAQTKPFDRR